MQGLKTNGIKRVDIVENGKAIRLTLEQETGLFWLDLPPDNVESIIGLLSKAVKMCRAPNEGTVTIVSDLEVHLDQAGDVLLTLATGEDTEMTYLLKLDLVTQLSAFLDTALQSRSGSSQAH